MYIGVDIGTSLTKAVAFDRDGREVASESVATELDFLPGNRVEQDAVAVVASVGTVVRALAARLPEPAELLALTGQGDGVWLLDADGRPVRRAISWMDGRAAELVREWHATDVARTVFQINGTALFSGAAGAILAHLDTHEPETLDRAATAGYCKDMAFQWLTGLRTTDPSDAYLPFGDPGGGYHDTVLRATGLTHRRHLLAPVHKGQPVAPMHAAGAQLTGLAEGTPVVAAPFDLPACARGAGVTRNGDGMVIVGTTLACQVARDAPETTGEPGGMSLPTQNQAFLRAMPAMVGTASLDWALRLVGRDVTDLDALLAESPPGARGVSVLPYLAPSGERAPFVDPYARGQVHGLGLHHAPADIARGVCEGIAYAARHCLHAAGLTGDLVLCGGGTRSTGWLQAFTNVMGRTVRVAANAEVGARGAVLAALAATGHEADEQEWTRASRTLEPDPRATEYYNEGYQAYLRHLAAARPLWGPLVPPPRAAEHPTTIPEGTNT